MIKKEKLKIYALKVLYYCKVGLYISYHIFKTLTIIIIDSLKEMLNALQRYDNWRTEQESKYNKNKQHKKRKKKYDVINEDKAVDDFGIDLKIERPEIEMPKFDLKEVFEI